MQKGWWLVQLLVKDHKYTTVSVTSAVIFKAVLTGPTGSMCTMPQHPGFLQWHDLHWEKRAILHRRLDHHPLLSRLWMCWSGLASFDQAPMEQNQSHSFSMRIVALQQDPAYSWYCVYCTQSCQSVCVCVRVISIQLVTSWSLIRRLLLLLLFCVFMTTGITCNLFGKIVVIVLRRSPKHLGMPQKTSQKIPHSHVHN